MVSAFFLPHTLLQPSTSIFPPLLTRHEWVRILPIILLQRDSAPQCNKRRRQEVRDTVKAHPRHHCKVRFRKPLPKKMKPASEGRVFVIQGNDQNTLLWSMAGSKEKDLPFWRLTILVTSKVEVSFLGQWRFKENCVTDLIGSDIVSLCGGSQADILESKLLT